MTSVETNVKSKPIETHVEPPSCPSQLTEEDPGKSGSQVTIASSCSSIQASFILVANVLKKNKTLISG